ncbi:MAG: lipopolysaccharide kinase InaA family protein [Planctomycetota bacterium]
MSEVSEGSQQDPQSRPDPGTAPRDIMTARGRRCTGLFVAGMQEVLLSRLEQEAEAGLPFADLATVKQSTVRRVLCGTLAPGLDIHLKLFRALRFTDKARDLLGGARGVVEFRRLCATRARGLPAVEPLAAGNLSGSFGTRSFLITRTVDGATALPRAALPVAQAEAAGRLLRRAHDSGLLALDLHPGNLLCTPQGGLVLCDLTAARLSDPLDVRQRALGLAFFCQDLPAGVRDPAAAPLLHGYAAWPALIEDAARRGVALRTRLLVAFGRRATRACSTTRVAREADDHTWFLCSDQDALHAAARAFTNLPAPPPLKSGRRGAVWLSADLAIKERSAPAARRLFQAGYRLRFAGVPIPPLVALHLHHGVGRVFSARLHAPTLRDELRAGTLAPHQVHAAARSLGHAVGRLHAHGLRNRDMKLENLIRDPQTDAVLTVDLDGVRRKSPHDSRGQAADLGRLLAAFREHAHPATARVVRTFWRSYVRARQCLDQRPDPNLRRLSAARARAFATRKAQASAR